jgi:hypothetical protein
MRSQVRALLVPFPINLQPRVFAFVARFAMGATRNERMCLDTRDQLFKSLGFMLANEQIALEQIALEQIALLIVFGLSIAAILLRMAANRARDIKCPYCGWLQVRRSSRHGLREWLLKGLFVLPHRCLACQNRFFRFGLNFRHSDQRLNSERADTKQLRASGRLSPK